MCLYSYNTKPLVCDKDLTVFKRVKIKDNGCILTPFQLLPVKYGENMIADGKVPSLDENYTNNEIGEGVIHSYINIPDDIIGNPSYIYLKSCVKAGTPFFVSFDGQEIASRELLLGGENDLVDCEEKTCVPELEETRKAIYDIMRGQCVTEEGIRVGDVLLADKTYISPDKITEETDAIGIVAFIRDGKPYVISLKEDFKDWGDPFTDEDVNTIYDTKKAVLDFNGKECTGKLYKEYRRRLKKFPVLNYCVKYKTNGTKEKDWYIPSVGEMVQAIRNLFVINATVEKLGETRADKVKPDENYWTVLEAFDMYAWCCNGMNEFAWKCPKNVSCNIRPFLNIN